MYRLDRLDTSRPAQPGGIIEKYRRKKRHQYRLNLFYFLSSLALLYWLIQSLPSLIKLSIPLTIA